MSANERIVTENAPRNDNPYSQGVRAGETLYVSGYGPVDPETGDDVEGDVGAQTHQMDIIAAVIEEAGGGGLSDVVKVTVYLPDFDDYNTVNEAYGARFADTPPTLGGVEVTRLPEDVEVEMDAVASLG